MVYAGRMPADINPEDEVLASLVLGEVEVAGSAESSIFLQSSVFILSFFTFVFLLDGLASALN